MLPSAKKTDLMYVADAGNYNVYVYDYPSGTAVGTIDSAYGSPTGLCVDKKGDVFVTEYNGQEVLEYAHGGTNPIAELYDDGQPVGCAIDPITGNLAVANEMSASGGYGNVAIYLKAKGMATEYQDLPYLSLPYWCTYDNRGNLYVDGEYNQSGFKFAFAEMPAGSTNFTQISLPNANGLPPSNVQWDGKYLTVLDQGGNSIYQYTISGTKATLKHTIQLAGAGDCAQSWIVPGLLYCGDAGNDNGEVFKYPSGTLAATFTGSFDEPLGVVAAKK